LEHPSVEETMIIKWTFGKCDVNHLAYDRVQK